MLWLLSCFKGALYTYIVVVVVVVVVVVLFYAFSLFSLWFYEAFKGISNKLCSDLTLIGAICIFFLLLKNFSFGIQ